MTATEDRRDRYLVSTDESKLNTRVIHRYLSETSYWARGRAYAAVERSIKHSLCFGVYDEGQQVGFARVVTDYATFAWLCE